LKCKKRTAILMCLGSEIVIGLTPKVGLKTMQSKSSAIQPLSKMRVNSLTAMEVSEDVEMGDETQVLEAAVEDDMDLGQDEICGTETTSPVDMNTSSRNPGVERASTTHTNSPGPAAKPSKHVILVTLVHGDAMTLSGDDFEVGYLVVSSFAIPVTEVDQVFHQTDRY
jgi:hypothetical protein